MTHNFDSTADPSAGQARPPKPVPLQVIPEHIPAELKALKQWVCWRYWWDEESGKWTKPPYRPTDGNATSHNANEGKYWTSFEFALQRYLDSQSESWRFDGIGLVLLPENNITGFDLDHCRDPETGEVNPWALDIIQQAQTYWEVSPSGTGLRGFASGHKPGSRCREVTIGFEMYTSSRYLCISGHHLDSTPPTIDAVQDGIDTIYAQMFPPTARVDGPSHNGTYSAYPDEVILDAARREKHAAEFVALYDHGDIRNYTHSDGSPDPSRADAALCRRLSFYSKHEEQLDRLFRGSALNRPKWESRADYRASTITLAIQSTPDQWSGPARNGHPQVSDEEEPIYHETGVQMDSTSTEEQEILST
jgi:putative DNA primase/helicase